MDFFKWITKCFFVSHTSLHSHSWMWCWRPTWPPSVSLRVCRRSCPACLLKSRPSLGWTTPWVAPRRWSTARPSRGYMGTRLRTSSTASRGTQQSPSQLCWKGERQSSYSVSLWPNTYLIRANTPGCWIYQVFFTVNNSSILLSEACQNRAVMLYVSRQGHA